jgi:hypothetical protein
VEGRDRVIAEPLVAGTSDAHLSCQIQQEETMSFVHRVSVALLFVLGLSSPALATVAAIETRTPLSDHSEQGIRAAIEGAVKASAKAAAAMGLPRLALDKALVLKDSIIVRVLASDEGGDGDDDAAVTEPTKPTGTVRGNTI